MTVGDRAYIGPIVLFALAGLGVFGGGATVSAILAMVAVAWFGSIQAMRRREAEGEAAAEVTRRRVLRAAARERTAASGKDTGLTEAKLAVGMADIAARDEGRGKAANSRASGAIRERPPSLLSRIERGLERDRPGLDSCLLHPDCGPVTRYGHSGHGHGPSVATGLWCWHLDEWWLGRPDEVAPEGSDLAARRAQQAALNGGDAFAHKTYPAPG